MDKTMGRQKEGLWLQEKKSTTEEVDLVIRFTKRTGTGSLDLTPWLSKLEHLNLSHKSCQTKKYMIGKNLMKIDIELLHKERKQWRESTLLQTKAILTLSQELDNLRKQKEILQEKLLKSATQD